MKKVIIAKQAAATEETGLWLSQRLRGGQVVCLSGDLGGGKTTFMKGLARGLGVKETITSPTFMVEAEYKCRIQKAEVRISKLYHFDAYRVKNAREILALGWEEVLADPTAVAVVEWAERIAEILPPKCIWVRFKFIDINTREIKIEQ